MYPGISSNLDIINKYSNQKKITINYIYREEDLSYWNYANSGFYKFKPHFIDLITSKNLLNDIKIHRQNKAYISRLNQLIIILIKI